MAFKSVVLPWLSGGLIVVGYAAFNRLRAKRALSRAASATPSRLPTVEPLCARLEHLPPEIAVDLESERLPANSNALPRSADLGALFLGRASEALSSVRFDAPLSEVPR